MFKNCIQKFFQGGDNMFKTSTFSKMCGLSADTLRHYEKMKILIPGYTDNDTRYRYYSAEQLLIVNKIAALKDAGFSLKEIAAILNNKKDNHSLTDLLEEKALSLEKTLVQETKRLKRLYTNIFLIKNGGVPLMNEITIKKTEPVLAASLRRKFHKDFFDKELEEMWNKVNDSIEKHKIKKSVPCLMIYHTGWWNFADDEKEEERYLDVEISEPVLKTFESNNEIRVYKLPAEEKMACVVHQGSFETIGSTFEAFFKWIRENNYAVNGPLREIYHKGDWAADNPDEYITELQVPVK